MKLKSILATALLAAAAALSLGAQAAADTDKAAAAKAPAMDMHADKMMKPDSKVEQKAGVPQKAPETKADKPDPTKDKKRHLHPRDGK